MELIFRVAVGTKRVGDNWSWSSFETPWLSASSNIKKLDVEEINDAVELAAHALHLVKLTRWVNLFVEEKSHAATALGEVDSNHNHPMYIEVFREPNLTLYTLKTTVNSAGVAKLGRPLQGTFASHSQSANQIFSFRLTRPAEEVDSGVREELRKEGVKVVFYDKGDGPRGWSP